MPDDEFVYSRGLSDMGPDFAVPFRVIKRTKTRIYIDEQIYDGCSRAEWDARPSQQRRCFTLARATFDLFDSARGTRCGSVQTFYKHEADAIE